MKMIKSGEADLARIRFLGHDPSTGRTYGECQAEWDAEKDRVLAEWKKIRWWNFYSHARLRCKLFVLLCREESFW